MASSSHAQVGSWRAVFAAAAPRPELRDLLQGVGTDAAPPGSTVVKHGKARRVLRVPLDDGSAVYVKRYLSDTPKDQLRFLFRRSRAAQEYWNLGRLRRLGVPSVEPLCFAERRHAGRLLEAVLVTREVPEARPFGERLREGDPGFRLALLDALASLARRLHDTGLWHRDLHDGNVLAAPAAEDAKEARPLLVDVQKMRTLPAAVPTFLRVRDLGVLYHALRARLSPEERVRLLESYRAAGTHVLAGRSLRADVERAADRRARVRLRSRARRCVVRSTGFRIEREGPWRIYRRADVGIPAVREALQAHRGALAAGPDSGGFVSRDGAGAVTRIDAIVAGPPLRPPASLSDRGQGIAEPGAPVRAAVAVKEFRERGLCRLRGRGMGAWRGAHALLLRGTDTPAPLALVEERRFGLLQRSYLLTRWDDSLAPGQ